jgi:uncharacterized protein (TIGR00730 family)
MKDVCVYCASSTRIPEKYYNVARNLSKVLIENGYGIVYGGGEVGLMGTLANQALYLNGRITGVIPRFMVEVEWAHPGVDNMIIVNTMAERKERLIKGVEAVVALPGSTGTLEELIEVVSMKKLGLFTKPIIIVNAFGFYDDLLRLFDRMVEEQFMRPEHGEIYSVVSDVNDVAEAIRVAPGWHEDAIKMAAL